VPRRSIRVLCAGVLGLVLPLAPVAAREAEERPPVVERIEVQNNQYLQRETLLFYISTKPGDAYDEAKLRADFRRLWDTGFLDDLQIEVVDGQRGKVVRFKVTERKRIQIVDYRGSKELTTSTIEDELKKRDAQVKIDTFYDPQKARKVEAIIKEMLAQKGRPFATVKHEAKNIGGAGQQLSFVVDDGPKAKVDEIVFDGNTVFSDGTLRGKMKKVKEPGFFNLSWLGGKTTYTEDKWLGNDEDPRGDRGRLEDFYLNHGYVTARIGQPRISYTDGKSGTFKKKPVKLMKLEIPVVEGEQFKVGELKFEGLTVLKEDFVRTYFKMKPGDVYNDSKFKKAYEKLRDVYGSLGYFQWTGGTQRKPDPEKKVVDATVRMEEDKQYFIGRINFTGNDSTRDKVIRREVYMNEGEVFNTEALKMSIKRINQLGYFKPMEGAPDIRPSEKADNKVDVTFRVEEQNRNQFTFGGGVSGYEGAFLNASFSTTNFLGAGETVSLAAQTGSRSKNYSLSVSEPYFLDRPITAGLNVYLSRITYLSYGATVVGYGQQTQGIGVTSGVMVGRFSRAFASYSYQIIDIYDVDKDTIARLVSSPYTSSLIPTIDADFFGGKGRRYESGITPSWVRNTVDNPFQPRSGSRYTASFQYVGGFLQGSVNYMRPSLELVRYQPVGRHMALGVRGEVAYIHPFGDTTTIPYYQRYFLGGETQIRGYNIRTVAPYDPATKTSIGGNKFLLVNAEYYFDVFGPLRLLAFFDAGQAYAEGQGLYWKTMSTSTGVEARFTMPVLNVPFRLIYAWNPNRDFYQPATAFKFAVGTTF
jgi:outer membrane protein insertion porin family